MPIKNRKFIFEDTELILDTVELNIIHTGNITRVFLTFLPNKITKQVYSQFRSSSNLTIDFLDSNISSSINITNISEVEMEITDKQGETRKIISFLGNLV